MNIFRKISDWGKYERLHHYPALSAFDREAALGRLQKYHQEEYEKCEPWISAVWTLLIAFGLLWAVFEFFSVAAHGYMFFFQLAGWTVQYIMYRRIRRRIEIKVAAELGDGQLWRCIECGYDLRASKDHCPECGAPVRVKPI